MYRGKQTQEPSIKGIQPSNQDEKQVKLVRRRSQLLSKYVWAMLYGMVLTVVLYVWTPNESTSMNTKPRNEFSSTTTVSKTTQKDSIEEIIAAQVAAETKRQSTNMKRQSSSIEQQQPQKDKNTSIPLAKQHDNNNNNSPETTTGSSVKRKFKSISQHDIAHLVDLQPPQLHANTTLEQARQGREPILNVLHRAGVSQLDVASTLALPTQQQVHDLYGDEPILIGQETCQAFRDSLQGADPYIGPAGMFNTGTHSLYFHLNSNCVYHRPTHSADAAPSRHYQLIQFQVPWGKHTPASLKWNNTAKSFEAIDKRHVLPVVLIRDPYHWMHSMCRHPYAARFWHDPLRHCPNLVPDATDREVFAWVRHKASVPVRIKYQSPAHVWPSLVHLYNDWNQQYLHATYPRLMIRFEDLLFHPQALITQICHCVGGTLKEGPFHYILDNAKKSTKGHVGDDRNNFITAMMTYGRETTRYTNMTHESLVFANQHLDAQLMQLFHYKRHSVV